MTDKATECPECGCQEFNGDELAPNFRVCTKCKQEWWTDIEYTKRPPKKKSTYVRDKYGSLTIPEMLEKIEEMDRALMNLVGLKNYRDTCGRTSIYMEAKPKAWAQAAKACKFEKGYFDAFDINITGKD